MFNSLLNAVNVDSLILDIFIILAVVVAGALIVYFIWEAVTSAATRTKKKSDELDLGSKKETPVENNDFTVVNYSLDAEEEKEPVLEEEKLTEVDETKAEEEKVEADAEKDEAERANAERRAYLEARRQELIRRMQAEMAEEAKADEPEEDTTATEDKHEEVDSLAEERNALNEEKEKYELMRKELEEAKKELAKEPKTEVITRTVVTKGALSLDELKEKLAEAEEALRSTEKEFKQCKKEYTPLRRVWTTHEKDERKLRRKEALVAKQKVLLYGVNNYADIDEEKAKKLAEDLDLLDGLKLSVQHCEEVMQKNAERYPLLEKMYNVLNRRNEELKRDIAYYKSEIERLEAEDGQNAD